MSDETPVDAEVLPPTTAKEPAPEDRFDRAIAAILQGIALLDADGNDTKHQNATTRTDVRKSLETIRETLTPSLYCKGKFYRWTNKQRKLLYFLGETGEFKKSCALAGMDPQSAARFLHSPKFLEYFDERMKESAQRRGWTVDHWFAELDDVWEGRKIKNREQMEAIKELGARIAPKIERIQHEFDNTEFEFATRES